MLYDFLSIEPSGGGGCTISSEKWWIHSGIEWRERGQRHFCAARRQPTMASVSWSRHETNLGTLLFPVGNTETFSFAADLVPGEIHAALQKVQLMDQQRIVSRSLEIKGALINFFKSKKNAPRTSQLSAWPQAYRCFDRKSLQELSMIFSSLSIETETIRSGALRS